MPRRDLSAGLHTRPWLLVVLILALLLLVGGCGLPMSQAQGASARPATFPPGLTPRRVAATGSVAIATESVRTDSLVVAATWQVPPAADQYGPIQSLLFCVAGGVGAAWEDNAQCTTLPGNAQSGSTRLPFDLGGMGNLTGSVWRVRACVTSQRLGSQSVAVCAEDTFPVAAPAPAPVTGLAVQATVIRP